MTRLGSVNIDRLQDALDAMDRTPRRDDHDYVECEDCGLAGNSDALWFDEHFVTVDGVRYCVECAEKHLVKCAQCDGWVWKEDAVECSGFDRPVCPDCAKRMKEEDAE